MDVIDWLDITNLTSSEVENASCLSQYADRPEGWCSVTFDRILCWPPTRPRSLATLPCREVILGVHYDVTKNATKYCDASGSWYNYTDYSECHNIEEKVITDQVDVELTTVIYLAGYALSLFTLSLALFIFIYFKDLRCLRNTIHTNLMLTYILADLMWIFNFIYQMSMPMDIASCLIPFVLLHYFHLTNFFWMFVEGLYLYMLVVETFTRENIKLRAYLGIGWGVPLIIILIWMIFRSLLTDPTDLDTDFEISGNRSCVWIAPSPTDWIYQFPAVLVLGINLLFLVRIMWVLITKLRSANNAETEQYRKGSKALLVLIPLLGITYILFIAGPQSALYSNIRAFLLSTQGFTVGLLYCFVNTEVQNTLRHRWLRWKEERSLATRTYVKDSSPNTRTESIRLYSRHDITPYRKRESTCSETTTTTLLQGSSRTSNGPRSPFLQPHSEPV